MTPKDYILSTLEELKTPIQMEDVGNISLEDAICAKITGRIRKVVLRGNVVFDGENIMQPALGKVIYPK